MARFRTQRLSQPDLERSLMARATLEQQEKLVGMFKLGWKIQGGYELRNSPHWLIVVSAKTSVAALYPDGKLVRNAVGKRTVPLRLDWAKTGDQTF
jgi:hypothetical protein